jgi:hypothetical protein
MSTLHISDTLLDGYVALFQQLTPTDRVILLNKLTEAVTTDVPVSDSPLEQRNDRIPDVVYLPKPPNDLSLEELAGSWIDDRSAAEIVEDLRRSRTLNRCISFERAADSSGIEAARQVFGAWGNEENREDVDRMIQVIAENRMWDPTVEI